MMNEPSNQVFGVILLFGVVVLIVILMKYNDSKSSQPESLKMRPNNGFMLESSGNNLSSPGGYPNVAEVQPHPALDGPNGINPTDLLPRDVNNEWSNVNPASNDLKNLNLLSADQMIGINTVSSSLRNANYQERSEPVIPKKDIGPWGNSTIEPDTFRRPLEIGTTE